jgi:hypothetical protein
MRPHPVARIPHSKLVFSCCILSKSPARIAGFRIYQLEGSNKKRVTVIGNASKQRKFDKDKLREDVQTHAWQAQGRHPLVSPFKAKS